MPTKHHVAAELADALREEKAARQAVVTAQRAYAAAQDRSERLLTRKVVRLFSGSRKSKR